MLTVTWKMLVFLSVVNTLLFLFELMAMWLMVGLDGVFAVFSRRSQGLINVTFQTATLAITLFVAENVNAWRRTKRKPVYDASY